MPRFAYNAVDPSGRSMKGVLEAESEAFALQKLHDQQLHVTDIRETRAKGEPRSGGLFKPNKAKLKNVVVFSRQFATMVDAGIPILRCLEILSTQTKDPVLKQSAAEVAGDVRGGLTLNESLAKHPTVFNKLYVNMIRAAEVGGILDIILERLASFLEYELEVRGKIKSAMMYPVLVLCFSVLMLFALFTFVLPKFKEIFKGMDVEIPPVTNFLFSVGDIFQAYWWVFLILGAGLFVGVHMWKRTEKGAYQLDFMKLKFPIVGELVLKMSIARFSRTFGTLISSGIPIMRALEIVGETSGNRVIVEAIENCRVSIREGQKLSAPMATSGLFPAMVTHMVDIGEESGRLSEMLVKVGEFYDAEVESTVKGLTSMIEPMLIIFMGIIVGFIAISVMTPIFKLVNSVK
ncbi:MAG: type II secretion system F family protein [Armatimonadetes bacterium]|nr:type II secretion system F family protein [Armatimonadota bacterium]NOG91633.1 type II secretion system F family protein [Armatimonadota bacterium]